MLAEFAKQSITLSIMIKKLLTNFTQLAERVKFYIKFCSLLFGSLGAASEDSENDSEPTLCPRKWLRFCARNFMNSFVGSMCIGVIRSWKALKIKHWPHGLKSVRERTAPIWGQNAVAILDKLIQQVLLALFKFKHFRHYSLLTFA